MTTLPFGRRVAVWPSRGVCTLAVFVQVPLAAYAVTTSTRTMVAVIEDFCISDLILYLLEADLLSARIGQVARVPNKRACPNTPRYPDHFVRKQIAHHI